MAVIEERKNKEGKLIYRVKIRLKGRPSESRSFDRKTDAKIWGQQREVELRKERNFGSSAHEKKLVGDLIDRYIKFEIPKKESNRQTTETRLRWWNREIGMRPLGELTPAILAECRDRLLLEGHMSHKYESKKKKGRKKSPATVIGYMAALSHAFTVAAKEWGWLDNNPMLQVKKPTRPQQRVRFLDESERSRLLTTCKESDCDYLYPIVVIALSTGARYGEIMNLRWRDIDVERGVARLEKTKNKERRALPLVHHALEVVKELKCKKKGLEKFDLLFGRADGLAPMEIRKHWIKALDDAEIEDFRFHDLRHSAASYLAMNGATLVEIAEVLGHKTLQMVKRYAHLSDQHTAKVVERMNRNIFAANDNDLDEEEKSEAKS